MASQVQQASASQGAEWSQIRYRYYNLGRNPWRQRLLDLDAEPFKMIGFLENRSSNSITSDDRAIVFGSTLVHGSWDRAGPPNLRASMLSVRFSCRICTEEDRTKSQSSDVANRYYWLHSTWLQKTGPLRYDGEDDKGNVIVCTLDDEYEWITGFDRWRQVPARMIGEERRCHFLEMLE